MPNLYFNNSFFNKINKTKYIYIFIFLWLFTAQSFFPQVNNCLDFDGVDDFVSLNLNNNLSERDQFTIEMWLNVGQNKSQQSFFKQGNETHYRIEIKESDNGGIDVFVCNGQISYGSTADNVIIPGQWSHLAMVFDGTQSVNQDRLKLYINGVQQNLTITGLLPSLTSNLSSYAPMLGQGLNSIYFVGKMDDVRIWCAEARTQTLIQQYMNSTLGTRDNLLASYHFDEGIAGVTNTGVVNLNDFSGIENNAGRLFSFALTGTSSNWVSRVNPVSGNNCLQFDGLNDYVNLGGLGEELDNKTALTIEMWCNVSSWTQDATLFSKYDNDYSRTQIQLKNSGNFLITIDQGGTDDGNKSQAYTTTAPASTGEWFHLAIVFAGGADNNEDKLKLYINGQSVALTYDGTIYTSLNSIIYPAVLGAQGSGLAGGVFINYFSGLMDEVKIWNSARTQVEIQQNMFSPVAGTETGLVAYYNFNQGAAASSNSELTTLNDLSVESNWNSETAAKNFGILTNFALTGTSSNWVSIQGTTTPSGGGTVNDPYLITTLDELNWIAANVNKWASYYKQMANIDATNTQLWNSGAGWKPIGQSNPGFTGSYDGNGFNISNLYINRQGEDNIGFLGNAYSPCIITKLGLINVNIKGGNFTGGLVGYLLDGTINQCYTTGRISGVRYVGGFAGVGVTFSISDCYSTASVIGTVNDVGGFIGNTLGGTLNYSYSTGLITCSSLYTGGLVGSNDGTSCTSSFWDTQTSGKETSAVGAGKTTLEMKTLGTFNGWDIGTWNMDSGINNGYPYLDWQSPGGTPLPIELSTFTATSTSSTVKLNWNTATEVNNYGFEILRQTKNEDEWTKIGFVTGNGNSNSTKSYSFTDDFSVTPTIQSDKISYKLKQIDNEGQFTYSSIIEVDLGIPQEFSLSQNYPNPFNPSTTIKYSIPVSNVVSLKVFDVLGKEITTLVNGYKNAGNYEVNFDGSKLSSGTYFYQLKVGQFSETKKLLLLK